jgi:hypothetical protein
MKQLVIAISLILAACNSTPKIKDPTIAYPTPPAELMVPPKELKTIPTEESDSKPDAK